MDKIRVQDEVIVRGNICSALSGCRRSGEWCETNVILRFSDDITLALWMQDVKRSLKRAVGARSANSRHVDAHRVANAAQRAQRRRGVQRGGQVRGLQQAQMIPAAGYGLRFGRCRRGIARGRKAGGAMEGPLCNWGDSSQIEKL